MWIRIVALYACQQAEETKCYRLHALRWLLYRILNMPITRCSDDILFKVSWNNISAVVFIEATRKTRINFEVFTYLFGAYAYCIYCLQLLTCLNVVISRILRALALGADKKPGKKNYTSIKYSVSSFWKFKFQVIRCFTGQRKYFLKNCTKLRILRKRILMIFNSLL